MTRKEFSYNFYPFDLKLCRMVQLYIAHVFLVFTFLILRFFGGKMTSQD